MGILARLDAEPGRWDLSAMKAMLVGGSAVPRAMIAAFEERHGLKIVPGLGHDRDVAGRLDGRASRTTSPRRDDETRWDLPGDGRHPAPVRRDPRARRRRGRAVGRRGDGRARGARPVGRGPATTTRRSSADRWTDDGWFRTGDIVSIHPRGFIQIKDRSKDVIKSGGEWISSVELENALMAHPAVAEAAVIAIPDEKWAERPLGGSRAEGGRVGDAPTSCASSSRRSSRSGGCPSGSSSSTRSRRRASASSARRRCASSSRSRASRAGPDDLKAAVLAGGRRAVRARDVPDPVPQDGEVLVRVRAAGINFARRPDPARPLSADAGAAGGARRRRSPASSRTGRA